MWTSSTDATEYATFLHALLAALCGGDPSSVAWADMHSIGDGSMHRTAKGSDGTWTGVEEPSHTVHHTCHMQCTHTRQPHSATRDHVIAPLCAC